jgi:hypothetical protein
VSSQKAKDGQAWRPISAHLMEKLRRRPISSEYVDLLYCWCCGGPDRRGHSLGAGGLGVAWESMDRQSWSGPGIEAP